MKYISRNRYIDAVTPFLNSGLIKVFTGQRRVGKSYMLYQLIDEIKKKDKKANIIYINKEHYDFDYIKDNASLSLFFEQHKSLTNKNYLFIDEVQEIDSFEKSLRSIQAKDEAEIFITGSNAKLLSGELSTFLSGRYVEIKIYGLSFKEFLNFHKLEYNTESFNKYLKYGGLPGIKNVVLEEDIVFDYLRNIYAAILFKDVVKRYNIRNISFLENLIKYLADNIGCIVSAKKISDYLKSQQIKVTPNIVLDYINYLADAFFIFKVQRSDISGKKIFEVGEKYFMEDLGLRHSLIGYKQNDINKILENIVFLHLKIMGYEVSVGWEQGKEIDFICRKKGETLYIQVAYLITDEKVQEREFGNLLMIKDNYPKMVLSLDNFTGNSYKGIEHKNIMEFIYNV
ncbi:MAG: ATP-binding protein [Vicingaceae bacterium]|nr:ATP-binding protein [Vicingaceae bacterium]